MTLKYDSEVARAVEGLVLSATVRIQVDPGDATHYDFLISLLAETGFAVVALINFGTVYEFPIEGLHPSYVGEKLRITQGSAVFVADFINAIGKGLWER